MRHQSARLISSAFMFIFFSGVLLAADNGVAMLYGNGTTLVNGSSIPKSSAIFPNDLVQTQSDSVANITLAGSSVIILPDSLIQFQGNSVKLEDGAITISTSKAMPAQAGVITVTPAANDWTEFDVTKLECTIEITARKGDLIVQDERGTSTLLQGQQATRASEPKNGKKKCSGAAAAAVGPITKLTPYVAGGLGAAALTTWVLIQGDDPISPAKFK